ncbi:BTB-domain-containing protein [Rhizophagus irregularis]|uniref:BTB-domain-containing protein n=1 Tax=Rhizophagus irregularis TaxID=588596 RepID=A0A2N0R9G8_9GLOM|nr:BTB-domain-containing protein [Rhizophagus irregularis]
MTSFFHSNLSKDLSLILNDADDYNVIIQVGENNNTKEFRAHSVILRARSPYFKGALSSCWITKKNDMIIFNKTNITPNVFDIILRYIYTGELNLTKQSCEDILGLLIASDELLIEELCNYIQDYLIVKPNKWIKNNFTLIFRTAFKLTGCKKLQDYCFESICKNFDSFITTNDFLSLDKDILYELLKRDDLQIEEVVAWDYLIKWGIEQTPGLGNENNDRTKWNNENYEALKKTLNQFIPLIRFVDIFSDKFFDKVQPYKNIISDQIYKEFEDFYNNNKYTLSKTKVLPPRIGNFESEIIKPKLVNIIINWINRKDYYTINDSRYRFNLIYRSSLDGISKESFKIKCKGQVESLVLIKVERSNKIFGGYSSIGLNLDENDMDSNDHEKFYYSSDNFIFSFENNEDIQNMKISRIINHYKAIYNHSSTGFNFGFNSLFITFVSGKQYLYAHNESHNYEDNLNTNEIYVIEEIETFNVTKE